VHNHRTRTLAVICLLENMALRNYQTLVPLISLAPDLEFRKVSV
jgi:hypothetical protein